MDVLPELFRLAQLDGEVEDWRKRAEIKAAQRLNVIGAGQGERRGVGEEFQSFGSMR